MVSIRIILENEFDQIFEIMKEEGEDWSSYHSDENAGRYRRALRNSICYGVWIDDELCGYIRCRDDDGFGFYIYDLLVSKRHRGQNFGRLLMDQAKADFSEADVYVMSDVDEYYQKQGFIREGTIFKL